jgi:hypothetical protein
VFVYGYEYEGTCRNKLHLIGVLVFLYNHRIVAAQVQFVTRVANVSNEHRPYI